MLHSTCSDTCECGIIGAALCMSRAFAAHRSGPDRHAGAARRPGPRYFRMRRGFTSLVAHNVDGGATTPEFVIRDVLGTLLPGIGTRVGMPKILSSLRISSRCMLLARRLPLLDGFPGKHDSDTSLLWRLPDPMGCEPRHTGARFLRIMLTPHDCTPYSTSR